MSEVGGPRGKVRRGPAKKRVKPRTRFGDAADLALIGSSHAMSDGFSNMLVSVLALIVADLSLSETQVGFVLSAFSLSTFLFVFPVSLASDHSGRKLLMLVLGMTVASLAYVSMLAVASLAVLVVLAFVAGAGNSVYHPCGTALTAERFPSIKPYAISVHGMMGNIGASVMPIVLGLVAGVLGWRGAIAVCTAPMLLILPALALRYRSVEPTERPHAGDLSLWGSSVSITRTVFRERNVLLLAVVYALGGMATKAAVGFIPLLAKGRFGFDTSVIGVVLAVYFGMGIAAKPVMGFLYAKLGPRAALFAPLIVSFAATFAIGLAPWPGLFLVLVALVGATSPISPVILTAASDYADPRVLASSVGLIYSLHAVGFVAPTVAGLLAERAGMAYAYAFAGALFLAAASVTLALHGRPVSGGVARD